MCKHTVCKRKNLGTILGCGDCESADDIKIHAASIATAHNMTYFEDVYTLFTGIHPPI